ncbi:MAG: TIGR00266 family protein [Longimicrobiales bacterium]
MADAIEYTIHGDDMQAVEIELDPQEGVRAEAGAMLYLETGIEMQTSTGGGLFAGLKRALTGETFFITSFVNAGATKSRVAFSAPYPGKILALDLARHGGSFLCQKDSFLCAAAGIDIEVAFTRRLGAGLLGGEGFILQKLTGAGLAFVHAGGTVIQRELAAAETLRVDTGCVVGFAATVDFDIQFIGGFRNALFGGEGLFLTTLTGPGLVLLQTLPFSRLADRIVAAAGHAQRGEKTGVAGVGSSVLGGVCRATADSDGPPPSRRARRWV